MTLAARLIALFPAALLTASLGCLVWLIARPGIWPLIALAGLLYLVPLLAFRLHQRLWPMKLGASYLASPSYNPWWGTHQLQAIYLGFPALEAALRLVPGLYSAWLRLWGARIGRRVHWTPLLELTDRSLLDIGDDVIIGHRCGFYGHIIKPTKNNLLLYCKPITIGSGAFIGAGSSIAPGVKIAAGVMIELRTELYPNKEVP